MSKFKTGDEIWWFEFPENGCGGHWVEDISLHMYTLNIDGIQPQPFWSAAYKSKDEAINAIIEHVKQLKPEIED